MTDTLLSKLGFGNGTVDLTIFEQRSVIALGCDTAAVQNEDTVSVHQTADALSDHDGGAAV